jgi:hypothetical protein
MFWVAAQAAALEAARLGGGGGPNVEEYGAVQWLDVRWLLCGCHFLCCAHARGYFYI